MNRKAFTLLELMGVITILGLISILVAPTIINQINKSKYQIDDVTKQLIFSATDLYLDNREYDYPKENGSTYCLDLQTLVDDGKLSTPILDSNGNEVKLTNKVTITVRNGNYSYKYGEKCETETPYLILNVTTLSMVPGETYQLRAKTSNNSTELNDLIWTSSDSSLVSVTQNGLVTAINPGRVTITVNSASDPTLKATVNVVVVNNTVPIYTITTEYYYVYDNTTNTLINSTHHNVKQGDSFTPTYDVSGPNGYHETDTFEYYDSNNNLTQSYDIGSSFTVTENATIHMYYSPNTYYVIYDANGGEGAPEKQEYLYNPDANTELSDVTPTKTGYTFQGWSETKDSTTAKYQPKDEWWRGNDEDHTLYAVWGTSSYVVNFYDNTNYISEKDTVIAIINGRTFTKTNDGAALAGYMYDGTWTGPVLVGTTPESVAYTSSHQNTVINYAGTLEYNGETYYYSEGGHWWTGNLEDTSGLNRTKYTITGNDNVNNSAMLTAIELLKDNTTTVSQTFTYGQSQNLTANTYTKTGHTFAGWSTSPTGNVVYTDAQSASNLTTNGTVNLYAIWTPNTYTVYMDHYYFVNNTDPVHFADSEVYVKYGMTYTPISGTAPTGYQSATTYASHYSYPGQNPSYEYIGDGTVGVDSFVVTQEMIINLLYYPNTYTISYDANGGSGAPAQQSYIYNPDANTTLSSTTPTRTGYIFLYWSQRPDGSVGQYYAGQGWSRGNVGNYTLYAVWAEMTSSILAWKSSEGSYVQSGELANSWISYRFSSAPAGTYVQYCVDTTNTCTPNITATGDNYISSNSYIRYRAVSSSDSSNVGNINSFYGNVSLPSYTVTTEYYYIYDNTTATLIDTTYDYVEQGNSFTPTYKVSTPTGYYARDTYEYYNSSGTYIQTYSLGSSFTVTDNTKLHMYFYPNTYYITYDANGGSGAPAQQSYIYNPDATINLSTTAPTRTGYTFQGWALAETPTTVHCQPGAEWWRGNTRNYTLVAVWQINSYVFDLNIYNPDGSQPYTTGEAGSVEMSVNGGSYTRLFNEPAGSYPYGTVLSFRNFTPGTGRYLSSVTGVTESGGVWTVTVTDTTYVQFYTAWNTYTVQQWHHYYHQNTSSWVHFQSTADTVTYGSSFTPYNVSAPSGYYAKNEYAYYNDNGNGNYVHLGNGTVGSNSFTVTQNMVVNVYYSPNSYTITQNHYYLYDNTTWTHFNTTTDTRVYDTSFAPYNVSVPTGYYAGNNYGYYNGSGTQALGTGTVGVNSFTVTDNHIVNVHYYPNTYYITYDANGGSGAPAQQSYIYNPDANTSLSGTTPTRVGYKFLGWSQSSSATSASYSAGQAWWRGNASNYTLYAVWQQLPNEYVEVQTGTVTYNDPTSYTVTSAGNACAKNLNLRYTWGQSYNAYTDKYKVYIKTMEASFDSCSDEIYFGNTSSTIGSVTSDGVFINEVLVQPMSTVSGSHYIYSLSTAWATINPNVAANYPGVTAYPWSSGELSMPSSGTIPIRINIIALRARGDYKATFTGTYNVTLKKQ